MNFEALNLLLNTISAFKDTFYKKGFKNGEKLCNFLI